MTDDIFLQVNKPGRYIGGEWNVSKKDFNKANIKFALCFPDLYEIGMSNLGIRIIYGMLNEIPDLTCERFFAVSSDMENILRNQHLEIFSLESKRPLREFDIIGFSLGTELNYTNALKILNLGSISLEASHRDNDLPLVIAGGPCALNPEPMHEFFDLFIIGEAEEALLEVIDVYRKYKERYKSHKVSKQDLLLILSGIEGVYVPALYEVKFNSGGEIEYFKPKISGAPVKIKKRFVRDLDSSYFPIGWLVPYIQLIHDRITLEIMRGCPNKCRFCQGRSQYFPLRQRSVQKILGLAQQAYSCTGYEELSLAGLSVSDYTHIEELLQRLIGLFEKDKISISLPSIKAKTMVGELASLIAGIKKTGLTFAPEAGLSRMRSAMGKDFNEADFFQALKKAYLAGYQQVKLYFMIGLPNESEEDLAAIIAFSVRVSELRREAGFGPARVNISVNTLIPKSHTPLQWFGMAALESIKTKQDYIRKNIRNKRIKVSFHNRYMGFLEGVLSRGDRRLSKVILQAFLKGASFDAWESSFSPEKWADSFKECNIDPQFYLKEKSKEEILPWDFIDALIPKELLREEFEKVIDM
ncbi:MAG: TIGR03960 family B12-binding radical SAM protein [Candidatus Omnitrophota bacterium]|nr:TIGR03960 family B12-binding radical SAM protein [Candidatus Omnitrophota bacterium]